MKLKEIFAVTLSFILLIGCFSIDIGASCNQYNPDLCLDDIEYKPLSPSDFKRESIPIVSYALGILNQTMPANSIGYSSERIYLDVNEVIVLNCSYSPSSANVNFGLIAPDGLFYYVNSSNGSIHQSIQVTERGYYTIAIENMSSYTISVTGYVNY